MSNYVRHICKGPVCNGTMQKFRLEGTRVDYQGNITQFWVCTGCEVAPPRNRSIPFISDMDEGGKA